MGQLVLKRASASRLSGEWSDDDYGVLADGTVVGRYEPTREAAMAIASTPCSPLPANFILLLRWRNTLSSGMLTTRFLFPKFFLQKKGEKIGGGSSNRKFREWFVCGSGPAPPRPLSCRRKVPPGV
jgi:hypothetical protein